MMSLLKRYIAKSVLNATLVTAFIIIAVMFIITLLGELKNLGKGDYGFIDVMSYVLMRLPNDVYQFLPLLVLLGCMIGLSIMSSHRELAVMRASGFSVKQIIQATLTTALIVILSVSLLGESIAPNLSQRAEMNRENAQNAGQAVVTSGGVWMHVDNNFIHIRHKVGRTWFEGVTRYQFDNNHQLQVAYYAKSLRVKDKQWVMNDVVKTEFYPDRTRSQSYLEAPWDLKLSVSMLNVAEVEPTDMSLPRLHKYVLYLHKNGLQASAYQYSFWQRVFQPLASLLMIFLAIPFVLSTLSTAPLSWRIVVGVMVGFSFYILNALLGQMCIVYQLPVMMAALLPLILFGGAGVYLMKKVVRF